MPCPSVDGGNAAVAVADALLAERLGLLVAPLPNEADLGLLVGREKTDSEVKQKLQTCSSQAVFALDRLKLLVVSKRWFCLWWQDKNTPVEVLIKAFSNP